MTAWKLGLKAIAVYRDGCKRSQPLNTTADNVIQGAQVKYTAQRERLPDERRSITHKFSVGGHEGYIHLGFYDDGRPGEIFVKMAKEGSTISGLIDALCTGVSIALQYGIPLEVFIRKHINTKFDPSGWTNNENIRHASSVIDYIFRWLALKTGVQLDQPAVSRNQAAQAPTIALGVQPHDNDAPSCHECGNIMVRSGSCYRCVNCGATSGCS
jgi:ribonucleoside-diphosphate reductase alpha chain